MVNNAEVEDVSSNGVSKYEWVELDKFIGWIYKLVFFWGYKRRQAEVDRFCYWRNWTSIKSILQTSKSSKVEPTMNTS